MDDARTRAVLAASYRASAVVAVIVAVLACLEPYTPAALFLGIVTGLVFVMMTAGLVRRMGPQTQQAPAKARRPLRVVYALKLFVAGGAMFMVWRWLPDRLAFFAAGYTIPVAALLVAALADAIRRRVQITGETTSGGQDDSAP